MDSKKIVWRETGIVAAGVLPCTALMIGVFAMLGKFDISVALGGAVGALLAIGNFFFMAVGITLAADKAEKQEVNAGKLLARNSYMIRLLVLAVLLFACAKSGVIFFATSSAERGVLAVSPSLFVICMPSYSNICP